MSDYLTKYGLNIDLVLKLNIQLVSNRIFHLVGEFIHPLSEKLNSVLV